MCKKIKKIFHREIIGFFFVLQRVLIFLHDDCKLSHGNINTSTVFVDAKTCDWKLACLEFVQSINEDPMNLPSRFLPACQRYEPPAKKSGENQK
jgi:hypothetical protein